jgi:hypothetical protein
MSPSAVTAPAATHFPSSPKGNPQLPPSSPSAAEEKKRTDELTGARVDLARAKIQAAQLQTQIDTLSAEKTTLEARARAALDELAVEKAQRDQRLVAQIAMLQEQILVLQQSTDAANAARTTAEDKARADVSSALRQAEQLASEKATLEIQFAQRTRDATFRAEAERASLEQQLSLAKSELDKASQALQSARAQVDTLQEEKRLAESRHNQTRQEQEEQHAAATLSMVQQLSAAQVDAQRVTGGQSVLQTQIELLRAEKAAMELQHARATRELAERHEAAITAMDHQLAVARGEADKQRVALQRAYEAQENVANERRAMEAQHAELVRDLQARHAAAVSALEKQVAALRADEPQRVQLLRNEQEASKQAVVALQQQIDALNIERLSGEVRAAQEQHELRQAHRDQIARLEATASQLRSDLTHCEQLNCELQERSDSLAAERLTLDDRTARALREKETEFKLATASLSLRCQTMAEDQQAVSAELAQVKRESQNAASAAKETEIKLRATVEELNQQVCLN